MSKRGPAAPLSSRKHVADAAEFSSGKPATATAAGRAVAAAAQLGTGWRQGGQEQPAATAAHTPHTPNTHHAHPHYTVHTHTSNAHSTPRTHTTAMARP